MDSRKARAYLKRERRFRDGSLDDLTHEERIAMILYGGIEANPEPWLYVDWHERDMYIQAARQLMDRLIAKYGQPA